MNNMMDHNDIQFNKISNTGSVIPRGNIRQAVKDAMQAYFEDLDGHDAHNLYRMVVGEVEKPLFEAVLDYARGNQSHAADLLGINRGTLRKKLREHGLD